LLPLKAHDPWRERTAQACVTLFMENKRGSQRRRVLKSGKIVFGGGAFSVDCTIRDLSESGARLQVPTSVAIPDRFVHVDAHAAVRREAVVVWRKGDQLGVRFQASNP
jgi:hypothetical protein